MFAQPILVAELRPADVAEFALAVDLANEVELRAGKRVSIPPSSVRNWEIVRAWALDLHGNSFLLFTRE